MPQKPRTEAEILKVKNKILKATLSIVTKEGYTALSMRKIAKATSMSATNIYNYYKNKDDVYLSVLTEGYNLLYDALHKKDPKATTPEDYYKNMVIAFSQFALSHPYYYEIMFENRGPMHLDYVGSKNEKAASLKFSVAINCFNYVKKRVCDCLNSPVNEEEGIFYALQFMTQLHGALNFYHNHILREVCDTPEAFLEHMVSYLIENPPNYLSTPIISTSKTYLNFKTSID